MPDSSASSISLPSDQDSTGRSFGAEEAELLLQALRSGTLTSTRGRMVKGLEERFAALLGRRHAHACASGTAAIHLAVAAVDPSPGSEIITTAITDMGAITPILFQSAIPVFADVDGRTGNVTAQTVAARISPRTCAIIVTHLFGNPAPVDEIAALARQHGIPVIEDCAQAYLAELNGRQIGTFGDIACFSLQQGKHISAGEGGVVATDDPAFARRMYLFLNKGWGYGDPNPDHEFLALNYRMSELQGAVALAQLEKLHHGVAQRQAMAERLSAAIAALPGLAAPRCLPRSRHSYWRYALAVSPAIVPGGPAALAGPLREAGIACAPRYIQKPAFQCRVIREQRTFGPSRFPFTLARADAIDYSSERFAGTYRYLDSVLVLPWNERYEPVHVDQIAQALMSAYHEVTRSFIDA